MLNRLGRLTKIKQDQSGLEVPSGQFVTEKFPVLTFGPTPKIDLATWKFSITGLVDEEKMLDWEEFNSLPKVTLDAEFHCVTQWSRLQNTWEGVLFTDAYVTAPICVASRMGLLSGQYQQRFGIYDNIYGQERVRLFLGQTLLPALFQRAGYRTALVGKWHLNGNKRMQYETGSPLQRGFDEFVAIRCGDSSLWKGTPVFRC